MSNTQSFFSRFAEMFRLGTFVGLNKPYSYTTRLDAYTSKSTTPSTTDPETQDTTVDAKMRYLINGDTTNVDQKYLKWVSDPKNRNVVVPHQYESLARGSIRWVDLIGLVHDTRYIQVQRFADDKFALRKAEMYADVEAMKVYFTTPFTLHKLSPIMMAIGLVIFGKTFIGYPIHVLTFGKFSGFSSFGTVYKKADMRSTGINTDYMRNSFGGVVSNAMNHTVQSYKKDLQLTYNLSEQDAVRRATKLGDILESTDKKLDILDKKSGSNKRDGKKTNDKEKAESLD
ncbi:hypothetical protein YASMINEVIRUS_1243 [Yasminevirus sp. GU-2018]|uniref:Uncharacterized protein n=1 Tax=Yasminevirus sp. GU-2018 TaxID=2420051 RepID=A0A5K0UAR7_9VIRU|nr:hypothetical protein YASMINEVIRUS_1243 [Yasminevirus sp. GU-2018]